MRTARIAAIASHLPERKLGNDELAALYEGWTAEKILEKTGVSERRIAAEGETAADLAAKAAERLFRERGIDPASIDFLLFCTQTPDHILPTTACLLQARLGLPTACGALDFNLGCSGFVYGLSLAKGLIETGQATRVLLLTADTYSKLIHPLDKSVRTLFGDAGCATLVEAVIAKDSAIGPFVFGTDGRGGDNLIVPAGGFRSPRNSVSAVEAQDSSGNVRSADHLYMNGAEIMTFTLAAVPAAVDALLTKAWMDRDEVDLFVLHQANAFMLERLRRKLAVPEEKFVVRLADCGNTVSSSIPLALERVVHAPGGDGLSGARLAVLVGFGVGYSWAAACVRI
jgi:3-oxoacyl-[acyl-carrier-protein] synthase-3